MKNTNEIFVMYCPKCGREYIVDAFEHNPICEDDGAGLDFELAKKFIIRTGG